MSEDTCPINHRALPPMPKGISKLPVHRGFPVPYFVAWVDGVPDFRIMDSEKFYKAPKHKRCWVCGEKLGTELAFTIGPMCAVNRTISEPPSHPECAEWSARACPFLSRPHMTRREGNYPDQPLYEAAGRGLSRNPGVAIVWVTRSYKLFNPRTVDAQANAGLLVEIGRPIRVRAFREGRAATPAEVIQSIATGFPALAEVAVQEGLSAVRVLEESLDRAAHDLGLPVAELKDACLNQLKAGQP